LNERDYNLFMYTSFIAGFIVVCNWLAFTAAYNLPFTHREAMILLFASGTCFFLSLIIFFKKQIYLARFTKDLNSDELDKG